MAKTKYLTKALRCPDGTRKYIRGKTQAELDRSFHMSAGTTTELKTSASR